MIYYHLITHLVIPVSSELQKEGLDRFKKYHLILDIYKKKEHIPDKTRIIKITEMEKIIKLKRRIFARPEYVRILVALYLSLFCEPNDEDLDNIASIIYDTTKEDFSKYLFDKYQLTLQHFTKLDKYHDYLIDYINSLYKVPEYGIN